MSNSNTHAICQLTICPLRASASDESEIVSQLIFGDYVTILTDSKPWVQVRNEADGYEGWVDFKQLKFISKADFKKGTEIDHVTVANPQLILKGPFGNLIVFLGTTLPFYDGEVCRIGNDTYTLQSSLIKVSSKDISALSMDFLNAPYLWGGKSLFGIDCSGLVQIVFKVIGIQAPRDASQQVHIGDTISWNNRKINDIVFYTVSSSKVTHVGILIHENEIIHAHGRVRIDRCDENGIFNSEQKRYTHHFHSIKRWC